jgi:hypothetical protein
VYWRPEQETNRKESQKTSRFVAQFKYKHKVYGQLEGKCLNQIDPDLSKGRELE